MNKWLNDIDLEGNFVILLPLKESHADDLVSAASDGKLWDLWYTSVPNRHTINDYIQFALDEKKHNRSLPYVVVDKSTQKIIGSTRYCNAINNNRLEIGYTWYAKSQQRTGINTECKLLLLQHAFEQLNCIAVEFRTNWHNHPSRNAIARLGAKQDGVLRNHLMDENGMYRDTVVFSIIKEEWPSVKQILLFKINHF